jgi:hypothetical protein
MSGRALVAVLTTAILCAAVPPLLAPSSRPDARTRGDGPPVRDRAWYEPWHGSRAERPRKPRRPGARARRA